MRKCFVGLLVFAGLVAGTVHAALDTYTLTGHAVVLDATGTSQELAAAQLLTPSSATNGLSVEGTALDVTAYKGTGLLVIGQGARSGESHTSTVAVVYGFTDSPATALYTSTQTTATAKTVGYEINFDTLKGTNAALYLKATLTNVAGDDNPMTGSAAIVKAAPYSATQTVTGSAFDLLQYKGYGTLQVSIGAEENGATNRVGIVTLQRATTSGGDYTTFTAVTNSTAAASFTRVPYEIGKGGRFIKAVYTSSNGTAPATVIFNAYGD